MCQECDLKFKKMARRKRRKSIGSTKKALSFNTAQTLVTGVAGAIASRTVSKYVLPIIPGGNGIVGTIVKSLVSAFLFAMGGSFRPFAIGMAADTLAAPIGGTLGIAGRSRRRALRGAKSQKSPVGTAAVAGTPQSTMLYAV